MMMIISVIRTVLYFWLAVEFVSLAMLYYQGYQNHKRTKIIYSLQRLLFFLGIAFAFFAFLPILADVDFEVFDFARGVATLFLVPVIHYLRMFRRYSLDRKEMSLPEKEQS